MKYRKTPPSSRPADGAPTVEQEFVWEIWGLHDLEDRLSALTEQLDSYIQQGYDGTFDASKFLDRAAFEAHHERYLFLEEKYAECVALIEDKTEEKVALEAQRQTYQDQMKALAVLASLESHIEENKYVQAENAESVTSEADAPISMEYDSSSFVFFTAEEVATIKSLYRESDYTNENFALTDYDDVVSTAVLANDLYQAADEELYRESRPQYEWDVTAKDLFSMKEFDPLRNQLQVGDFVWLGRGELANAAQSDKLTYDKQKFRVMVLEFSGLKTSPSFDIQFSTMLYTIKGRTDLEELLDTAITSSVNSMSVGVTSRAVQSATNLAASLIRPYIEAINARIDNLTVQNATVSDLRATSALIEELTVFDLMAGNITADQSIVLTNREGYGSIVIENAQMRFLDAEDNTRVLIGKGGSGNYVVNIYSAADQSGQQQLLWGSDGIQAGAIADSLIATNMLDSQAVTTDKVAWSGISESVDQDGKPVWSATKVTLNGERLDDQWDALLEQVASVEIDASSLVFSETSGGYIPSQITLTPVMHVITDTTALHWYSRVGSAAWVEVVNTTTSTTEPWIDTNLVLNVPSGCTAFTDANNQISFKLA